MANHRGRRVAFFRVCFLVTVAACFSCDGGAPAPGAAEKAVAARLTAGRTAADEQARAAAYTDLTARYRRLADENKQAVADLTRSIDASIAPAVVRAKRQAAADLADRLAASSQKTADLHTLLAAELAARDGEVRR